MTLVGVLLFWGEIGQNFLGLPVGWAMLVTSLGLFILAFAQGTRQPTLPAMSGDGIWETIDRSSMAVASSQPPAAGSFQVLRLNRDALAPSTREQRLSE